MITPRFYDDSEPDYLDIDAFFDRVDLTMDALEHLDVDFQEIDLLNAEEDGLTDI
jgi:hypothetical protein